MACKNRATVPDLVDVITPITGTSTGQTPALTWGQCDNLTKLYNNGYTYYKSANGDGDTLEIINADNVKYNGKNYSIGANGDQKYNNSSGTELKFGSKNGISERYIEFKPSSTADYKKFTLQKKP